MTKKNDKKWDQFIQQVQDGFNEKDHSAILGSPDDLSGNSEASKVAQFQEMKENAASFEHNQQITEKKTTEIEKAGQYRVQLPKEKFERGFKPRYGEIRTVKEVRAGMVKDDSGRAAVPVGAVKPVPQGTTEQGPAPDLRGRNLRDQRLKEDLMEFARELYGGLTEEVAVTRAARMMPAEFAQAKPSTLLMSQFLRLYPNLFRLTGDGPSMRVRRVGRRLRGKQRG